MKQSNIIDEIILDMRMDVDDKTLYTKIKSLPSVDLTDSGGMTLLMAACVYNRLELAKTLIDLGADINIQEQRVRGYTALHAAVENRKFEAVKLLLENNANPNLQDKFGNIPLIRASHLDIEIIELLVRYGSDYNKDNFYGNSACKIFAAYPEITNIFAGEK
ncbi:MAG: ankyrin repeat domain-containing protein [Clostridia bacterium]|nr:ankyrin repeat domain-containing protein [Clostridia bacterium]